MKSFPVRHQTLLMVVLFFIVAGLLYLPSAQQIGYYDDDWYSMYAARVGGPQILLQFYNLDSRPVRALVMIPLYVLFQGNPLYYAISAYFFRVIGALTMLWMLRLVWPKHNRETFLTALLFLVYPGFLSQTVPVDFQSHLIGIWMAYLSIGSSIKSLSTPSRWMRLVLWAGAAVSGWFYLGLMEYYIGFEAARLFLLIMILQRQTESTRKNLLGAFKSWLPYAVIPLVFFVWRFFVFEGVRKVTDAGLQLGRLFQVPLHTALTWLVLFMQDVANVTLLAWSVPLSQLTFGLRLRDSLVALGLSVLVLASFYLVYSVITKQDEERETSSLQFASEGLWAGTAWVLAGLVFVILANRHVVFPEFSRYGFVSAGGAVVLLVAFLARIPGRRIQAVILGLLLLSATVTHYANGVRFATLADDIRQFWWQVSWRAPHFEPGTTIVAHYPNGGIRETSFVWGPANQIYYPDGLDPDSVQTGIAALLPNQSTVLDVLNQRKQFPELYYLVETNPDPRNIVILTQPSPVSCMQVIDGSAPEYSSYEDPMFVLIGPYSELGHIQTQASSREVPSFLFGAEPEHTWCYFYQKATLARQKGEWDEVLELGRQASELGYRPDDLIEWLPFLQAHALAGEEDELNRLANVIRSDRYVARQVCQILSNMDGLEDNIQAAIESKYCQP
ncbi:MAG: hypothetical protein AB1649_03280 [Chloroflexota bacterium]